MEERETEGWLLCMRCIYTDPWSLGLFLLSVTSLYSLMMTYRKIPWVIILCTLGIVLGYMCSHNVLPSPSPNSNNVPSLVTDRFDRHLFDPPHSTFRSVSRLCRLATAMYVHYHHHQ
jgi:hypothetical protein